MTTDSPLFDKRATITSGPDGFTVRHGDGRFAQTFRFGEGQLAWELARRLEVEDDIHD